MLAVVLVVVAAMKSNSMMVLSMEVWGQSDQTTVSLVEAQGQSGSPGWQPSRSEPTERAD